MTMPPRGPRSPLFSFATRHQPYMVRATYHREMRSALTYPLAAALAEGAFAGVVATKYFHASPVLLAVITAAPMFGNVMALLWAELAKARPKVRFVNWLQFGVVTSIAAVALTKPLPLEVGGWAFAGLIIAARLLASGIITLRSAIWRFNYPRQTRAQLVGRITMIATTVLAATTLLGAWWLDNDPAAFVYLYPLAALLGVFGIWQFAGIRVRKEGQLLRREREEKAERLRELRRLRQPVYTPRPESMAETAEANVYNYAPDGEEGTNGTNGEDVPEGNGTPRGDAPSSDGNHGTSRTGRGAACRLADETAPRPDAAAAPVASSTAPRHARGVRRFFADATQVLRDDPRFRAYQWWQFLNGAAFMLMQPALVFMVSREMTDDRTQYLLATVVLQIVPLVTSIVFTQVWAPLFDRVHISRFRVAQGFVSVAAHGLLLAGALSDQLWLVAAAQFVVGVSNAAGNLAWNLGHNDFAPPERAAAYMGVHVMLTGLRGSIAPFAGVLLFTHLGLGRGVFGMSCLMCCVSTFGFYTMTRYAPQKMPPARVKQMAAATGA